MSNITPEQLNEWLMNNQPMTAYKPRSPVVCKDGFSMSVQVGKGLYCKPSDNVGPWTTVEVGFPTQIEPLLWQYADGPGEWTSIVYSQVPVEIVAAVIELHGGFDSSEDSYKESAS